jgi:hypothetical protein
MSKVNSSNWHFTGSIIMTNCQFTQRQYSLVTEHTTVFGLLKSVYSLGVPVSQNLCA